MKRRLKSLRAKKKSPFHASGKKAHEKVDKNNRWQQMQELMPKNRLSQMVHFITFRAFSYPRTCFCCYRRHFSTFSRSTEARYHGRGSVSEMPFSTWLRVRPMGKRVTFWLVVAPRPCGKQHFREIPTPDFVRTLRLYPILNGMLDSYICLQNPAWVFRGNVVSHMAPRTM